MVWLSWVGYLILGRPWTQGIFLEGDSEAKEDTLITAGGNWLELEQGRVQWVWARIRAMCVEGCE